MHTQGNLQYTIEPFLPHSTYNRATCMGAELWYHEAPWHSNPSEALRALQTHFLAENYNLTKVLPQHLKWARESLAAAQADDDRYGLVDLYAEKVQLLER